MIDFIWSGRARRDLAGIIGRLHRRSPAAANDFEQRLFIALHELRTLRSPGYRRPDITEKDVFFYKVSPYVVVFRRTSKRITVSRVLHNASDLGNLI